MVITILQIKSFLLLAILASSLININNKGGIFMKERKKLEKMLDCYEKYSSQISSSIFFTMAITGALVGAFIGHGISSQQHAVVIILAILVGVWVGSIIGTFASIAFLIFLETRIRKKNEK